MAIAGDKLVAKTAYNAIAAVNPASGALLWHSGAFHSKTVSIGSDSTLVVTTAESGFSVYDGTRATVYAFSAANGQLRWKTTDENASAGRTIFVIEHMIVMGYTEPTEPMFERVIGLDRRAGKVLFTDDDNVFYTGHFRNELWLLRSQPDRERYAPLVYDRFDDKAGRSLGTYVYAPEPERNAGKEAAQSGIVDSHVALTDKFVMFSIDGNLYRYDRTRAPALQVPQVVRIPNGTLAAALGDDPVVFTFGAGSILTAQGSLKHHVDLPPELFATPDTENAMPRDASLPFVVVSLPEAVYLQDALLYAVTLSGDTYVVNKSYCDWPTLGVRTRSNSVIVLCRNSIIRLDISASSRH